MRRLVIALALAAHAFVARPRPAVRRRAPSARRATNLHSAEARELVRLAEALPREGVVRMEWDAERGDVLRAYTERGAIHRYDLFWETTVSDRGTCAVIDGDCLMLTPMFRTPVPPPM